MPNDFRHRFDQSHSHRDETYQRADHAHGGNKVNDFPERDRDRFDEHFPEPHNEGRGRSLSSATGDEDSRSNTEMNGANSAPSRGSRKHRK